jgi:hypothetical protein
VAGAGSSLGGTPVASGGVVMSAGGGAGSVAGAGAGVAVVSTASSCFWHPAVNTVPNASSGSIFSSFMWGTSQDSLLDLDTAGRGSGL